VSLRSFYNWFTFKIEFLAFPKRGKPKPRGVRVRVSPPPERNPAVSGFSKMQRCKLHGSSGIYLTSSDSHLLASISSCFPALWITM